MQDMNAHWHKASQQVKDSMRGFVFLDNRGNVKRIGPPKDSQALERFVREFAEGKTYIGIGAWYVLASHHCLTRAKCLQGK